MAYATKQAQIRQINVTQQDYVYLEITSEKNFAIANNTRFFFSNLQSRKYTVR